MTKKKEKKLTRKVVKKETLELFSETKDLLDKLFQKLKKEVKEE